MKIAQSSPATSQTEKLVFQETYLSITHNQEENWLYLKWQGERTEQTILQGAEKLLQIVRATGSTKIINDSTDHTNAWPKNLIDLIALEFGPRLQEAGIQYFAWIYDDQNAVKGPADAILKKDRSDIIVMVFDNVKTAETWLRSIN